MTTANIKPLYSLKEILFQIISPEKSIIDTFCFIWYFRYYFIVSSGVPITRGYIPLRGGFVSIPTPRCNECGKVADFFTNGYTVVPIPCIKDRFLFVTWDGSCLVKWGHCVMCFSCGMFVEWLKINSTAWFAILFRADHHPMAPSYWLSDRNWL